MEIVKELLNKVNRPGMDELKVWLSYNGFYEAPASARNHLNVAGGLAEHSYNVYKLFEHQNKVCLLGLSEDTVILTSILHDLCKINLYVFDGVGYKTDKVVSKQGHAKLSIKLIKNFIELSDEEENMIKYHMNLFGVRGLSYINEYSEIDLYKAICKYPSVQIFAACDMGASRKEAHE